MKFRTQFNLKHKPDKGEVNNMDSMTLPDDCLSLRQLLQNHTRGISSSVTQREAIYTGDTLVKNHQDITDEVEEVKDLKRREKELEQQIKKEHEEQEEKSKQQAKAKKEAEEDLPAAAEGASGKSSTKDTL